MLTTLKSLIFEKEAPMSVAAPFDGQIMLRIKLRQAQRQSSDPKEVAAIDKALADPDFVPGVYAQGVAATQAAEASATINWAAILQWILANLPQIIALIMTLFGI